MLLVPMETGVNSLERNYKMYNFTLCLHTTRSN